MKQTIEDNNYRKLVKGLEKRKIKKERIWGIDFLRCIPIILVMLYHLCYYFAFIPQMLFVNYDEQILNYPAYNSFIHFCHYDIFTGDIFVNLLQPFFSGVFLFVCGISCSLTRSNVRRSIYLWIVALLLSIATYIFSIVSGTNFIIIFGVIHLMAFSVSAYMLLELFYKYVLEKDVEPITCVIIGLLIMLIGYLLNWPENEFIYDLNETIKNSHFIALGKYVGGQDFFPIFPKAGIIFVGICFGKLLYGKQKKSVLPSLYFKGLKPFCFIGSHTIWFYFLHPPLFITIIVLVMMAMGFKIDFGSIL